jgi:hypothetical protein
VALALALGLDPGKQQTITIVGTLAGEDGDSRTFRFESGLGNGKDQDAVATPFAQFKQEIAIKKPFVQLAMSVNGSKEAEVIANKNSPIQVLVSYSNNLPVSVHDVAITVSLSGTALDKTSVQVDHGFYQSLQNAIVWDKTTKPEFAELAPGASGELSITLSPKQVITGGSPSIILSGSVTGKRIEEGKVPETINASIARTIKIESSLAFDAKITHFTGVLSNSGPIPPKAEKETTYTITWTVGNGINDITDTVVKAQLPPYVRFLGQSTPSNETVTLNSNDRTLMWDVGTVKAVGLGNPRTVSFKVGLTPSVSQIGNTVDIIKEATLMGNDRFTGTSVTTKANALTSRTNDDQYKSGDESVVP